MQESAFEFHPSAKSPPPAEQRERKEGEQPLDPDREDQLLAISATLKLGGL
ncbi:hypothetical protein FJZ28_01125 [Candidatus Peregrinibacteria bacterium]|nr:hypothetical protein [Candidatus Peregrinibacteria bacterium]